MPRGGTAVEKTGVRAPTSTLTRTGTVACCRASSELPTGTSWSGTMGTPGLLLGSRSTASIRCGLVAGGGFMAMASPSGARARHRQDGLDTTVQLAREHLIGVPQFFQGDAVGDDGFRVHHCPPDQIQQVRHVATHVALIHAQREPLVHGGAD